MSKVLILTDNEELLIRFKKLIKEKKIDSNSDFIFNYAFSPNNKLFLEKYKDSKWLRPLKIKDELEFLVNEYKLIISLHCKQLFTEYLVRKVKCINIHPGLNPYNRGYYPQVFSIINYLPCGATIHEIDEQIDHGRIICQKKINIDIWDTSLSVYNKILDAEIQLLSSNIEKILNFKYETFEADEGNLNLKKDFDDLCIIDLNNNDTFKNHINRLRALTHGCYSNAYFFDEQGNKIFVKLQLIKEQIKCKDDNNSIALCESEKIIK